MSCIYKIVCPITNDTMYIGRALDFSSRKSVHLHSKSTTPIGKWISDVKSKNLLPIFEIIENKLSLEEAGIKEDYWIEKYKADGVILLNKYTSSMCDKPGPKPLYDFTTYRIGDEIILQPIKQSSFKSMLSKFNRDLPKEERHQYRYEQIKRVIIAIRNK